jgi:hypothetical protein
MFYIALFPHFMGADFFKISGDMIVGSDTMKANVAGLINSVVCEIHVLLNMQFALVSHYMSLFVSHVGQPS